MKSIKMLFLLILACITSLILHADESKETKIARAMSAAPSAISDNATIMQGDGTILKQGTNGWTCLPDVMPNDKNPICNDSTWMKLLQALTSQKSFEPDRIGISYMLKGDYGAGVSNSDPYHNNHKDAKDYVETGPHLMIIVPKSMLKGMSTDPSQGGPYVMWSDTPYAHIMLPIDDSKVLMHNHEH